MKYFQIFSSICSVNLIETLELTFNSYFYFIFFRCREVLDNTVSIIKNSHALSACLIDKDRIVVGTEDGLFCVDLDRDEICRIGDGKKIHQVEYIPDEQLMIVLAGKFLELNFFRFHEKKKIKFFQKSLNIYLFLGKQRQMRLIPVKALDQPAETEWIKVADTKNCLTFATGITRSGTSVSGGSGGPGSSGSHCLCVAVKRQVIIYEITRLKSRHKRLREVLLPAQAQSLDVFSEGRLCVGYQSGFTIYR